MSELKLRGRGGKRPGAGRKPDYVKRLGITPVNAAQIMARYDEHEAWGWFLKHPNASIRLNAWQYLTDRRDGKPKQAIDVSGGLMHAHTTYRDPRLAALTEEELQKLDSITRKLALPAQDGPHNQIESNTEVEAANVESDASDVLESACKPDEAS